MQSCPSSGSFLFSIIMRTKILSVIFLFLFLNCTSGQTGNYNMKDIVEKGVRLAGLIENDYSVRVVRLEFDQISSKKESIRFLYSGTPYGILVFGDTRIKDIDLKISRFDNGRLYPIEEDRSEDDVAYIMITPSLSSKYIMEITAYEYYPGYSSGYYGLFVFIGTPSSSASSNQVSASGTCFALTNTGFLLTANHVVQDADQILIKGINGNLDTPYLADVYAVDPSNDIALLKINDPSFHGLGDIPFTIRDFPSGSGTDIFVMGYPLTSTMGFEIKLTEGIISSERGYNDDISSFQISAAVHPGNSGGPVFNSNGQLIGIVTSKHLQAENSSYAVKSTVLLTFLKNYPEIGSRPTVSQLHGTSLSDKSKILRRFVYVVETL